MKRLAVFLFLFFVVLGILFLSKTAQNFEVKFRIEKIVMERNEIVPTSEIMNFARINSEKKLEKLTPEMVLDRIEKHPYIKSADGSFIDSVTFNVRVREVEPFALIFGTQSTSCLTSDGKILPFNPVIKIYDLPIITGIEIEKNNQINTVNSIPQLIKVFETLQSLKAIDFALFSSISELQVDEKTKFNGYLSRPHAKIIFDKSFDSQKGIQLSEFWRQIVLNQNSTRYEYIDLRFKGQIVVKEKQLNQLTELI